MRLLTFSKLLAVGGAVAWAAKRFLVSQPPPSSRSTRLTARDLAPDPRDPVQGFDEASELRVTELAVDAMDLADVEAAQDLAVLESELDDGVLNLEVDIVGIDDTGELYGVHTPVAVDRELPDDDTAFADGQNWIEALEASAAEYGAEPEEDIDVVDDMDAPPHPSDMRDVPVADRGSGGPGGV